jgi:hypothetical protein
VSITDLLTQAVTVISQQLDGGIDEYGNDVPRDVPVQTVGLLEQRASAEREGYVPESSWLLVLPAGTVVQANDVVIVDDLEYSISGEPWRAWNPRLGVVDHVEAVCVRTAGGLETGS